MHPSVIRRTRGAALDMGGLDSGYGGGYYQPLKRGSYSDHAAARELYHNPDVRFHEALDRLESADSPEIPPSWVDPRKWEPSEHHVDDWMRPRGDHVSSDARSRGARYCDWQGPLPPSEQHVHHSRLHGGEEQALPGFGAPAPRSAERDARPGGRRGRGDRGGSARGSRGGSAYSDSRSRSGSRSRSRSRSGSRSGSSGRRRGGRRGSGSRRSAGRRSRSGSRSDSRGSGSSGSRSSASSERTKAKAQELKQKVEVAQKQEAAEKNVQGPQRKTRGIDLTDELLPVPGVRGEQQGAAAAAEAGAKSSKVTPSVPGKVPPVPGKKSFTNGATGDLSKVGMQPTVRPADAPKWKTGQARLKLRQEFNKHEINVKSLMEHYDVNRDGTLEPDEFQTLLKDQSWWKKKATSYELACVMALADSDEDENISTEEVLYALKVWYAYINMNKSVGRLLAPPVSDGPLPNQVLLTEVLTHMNDDHPVTEDEVRHVIESLRFLGASKAQVSTVQMRMAVAAWYLNVERDETPRAHLINMALENTHKKIGTGHINPLGKCCRGGRWDPVTVVGFLAMFGVGVVHPIMEIIASNQLREGELCFHWITMALRAQGYLSLVWFCVFVWLTTAVECCSKEAAPLCRQAAIFGFVALSFLCFFVWAFGLFQVMDSQASRCGVILWQYGNFSFVVMPVIIVLFACMGMPCMYCCEYAHNVEIERTLHEHEHDNHHEGDNV